MEIYKQCTCQCIFLSSLQSHLTKHWLSRVARKWNLVCLCISLMGPLPNGFPWWRYLQFLSSQSENEVNVSPKGMQKRKQEKTKKEESGKF